MPREHTMQIRQADRRSIGFPGFLNFPERTYPSVAAKRAASAARKRARMEMARLADAIIAHARKAGVTLDEISWDYRHVQSGRHGPNARYACSVLAGTTLPGPRILAAIQRCLAARGIDITRQSDRARPPVRCYLCGRSWRVHNNFYRGRLVPLCAQCARESEAADRIQKARAACASN